MTRVAVALAALAVMGGGARAQVAPIDPLQLRADQTTAPTADNALPELPDPDAQADDALKTKPKPVTPAKPKPKPGDLPPLRPYPGAQRLGLRGGPLDPNTDATGAPISLDPPGPTIAAEPVPPPRRKIPADANPFDPVGLRFGDVDVKPYVEEDIGYSANPLGADSGAKGSMLSTSEAGLDWQSVWSRDDFHGELKGGYTDYFAAPSASGAYGSGTVDGRVDATRDLSFDGEGRFNVAPESLSSFGLSASPGGASPFIAVSTFGATVGAAEKFGDLTIGLHGTYDRESYQDTTLYDAATGNLASDDYNDWGLRLRTSYRLAEAISPFLELGFDARRYDGLTDALGYQRDSNGLDGRVGVTLAFSAKLTGEASVGYGERSYQDPRLANAQTPLVDASLIWSATPLTTLTLKAASALNDSILAGASADINHTYTIDISHSLTRAVTLGLTGTYAIDDFVGANQHDTTATLGAKAEYHVSRDVVLKASATHQIFGSSLPNQGYVGDVFMLGIRLQR